MLYVLSKYIPCYNREIQSIMARLKIDDATNKFAVSGAVMTSKCNISYKRLTGVFTFTMECVVDHLEYEFDIMLCHKVNVMANAGN